MKPGLSGAVIGSLPERLRKREDRLVRLVARRQRADDLDELHQRHRVEEMQPARSGRDAWSWPPAR